MKNINTHLNLYVHTSDILKNYINVVKIQTCVRACRLNPIVGRARLSFRESFNNLTNRITTPR